MEWLFMNDRDLTYLQNMYGFAKRVKRRITDVSMTDFLVNEDIQDPVLYAIGQIGENANSVSEETRDKYHDILWNELVGVRNRVFHSYGDINMRIIYNVATTSITQLILQLESIEGVV